MEVLLSTECVLEKALDCLLLHGNIQMADQTFKANCRLKILRDRLGRRMSQTMATLTERERKKFDDELDRLLKSSDTRIDRIKEKIDRATSASATRMETFANQLQIYRGPPSLPLFETLDSRFNAINQPTSPVTIPETERHVHVDEEFDSYESDADEEANRGSGDAELVGRINKRRRLGAGDP